MALEVTIELGDGTVETLTVQKAGPISIGREDGRDLVLPSPDVSRHHLTVECIGHIYRVTDQSANGTQIGEDLLHGDSVDIAGGVPIRVGPYVLWLQPLSAPAEVEGQEILDLSAVEMLSTADFASLSLSDEPSTTSLDDERLTAAAATAQQISARDAAVHEAAQRIAAQQQVAQRQASQQQAGQEQMAAQQHAAQQMAAQQMAAQQMAAQQQVAKQQVAKQQVAKQRGGEASPYDVSGTAEVSVFIRKRIHKMLLENLDLASLDRNKMDEASMRPKVRQALRRIIKQVGPDLPPSTHTAQLIDEITDEALGLGPLERLLADDTVTEIMVVDPETIFVERHGVLQGTALRFTDDEAVRAVIERIVTPLGRRIDESTPLVDARLKDGSRVNAIIPPLAIRGSCITIRKFAKKPLTLDKLIGFGALTAAMAKFITRAVKSRKNIIISGGTGSGKTTLLNVLSGEIPENERVVTVEDAAELQLVQPHVVSLESKPPNMEGRGEYTIRDLVRNALRMRPDRIIVGECRGGEALDMLQAMNTGHEGSMTTTHANSPPEAMARIETLSLMAGLDLPSRAIREQISRSIDVVIQQSRFSDGSRRVTAISEVVGMDDDGEIELQNIFAFHRLSTSDDGKVIGEFRASGYLPSFLDEFIAQGLVKDGDFL